MQGSKQTAVKAYGFGPCACTILHSLFIEIKKARTSDMRWRLLSVYNVVEGLKVESGGI
jgi:hypothetical protein